MKKTITTVLIGIMFFWAFPALANGASCAEAWVVEFGNFQLRQGDAVLPNYSGSDQYYRIEFAAQINDEFITDGDLASCLNYIKINFSDSNSYLLGALSYGLYPDENIGDIREVGYLLRSEIYLNGYNSDSGKWEYNANGFTNVSLIVSIDKTIVDAIASTDINAGGVNLDFEFYFTDDTHIGVPGILGFSNLGYDLRVPNPDDVKVEYHADGSISVNWTAIAGNWFAVDGAHMKVAAVSINELNQMESTGMYHHNFVATWGSIPLHMSNYFIWNQIKDGMKTLGDGDFILYFATESNFEARQRAQIFGTKSFKWEDKKDKIK
jgi:hypothetical protein